MGADADEGLLTGARMEKGSSARNAAVNNPIAIGRELLRPYYLKWLYSLIFKDRYPAALTDCWRFPARRLEDGVGDWIDRPGTLPDILFLPASDWHTRLQRSQHLASEFANLGHRCFYLNPHLGREFRAPYAMSPKRMVSQLMSKVFELHVHLVREPVYHQRCLSKSESAAVVSAIEGLFREAQSVSPVIVVSLPLWNEVAEMLKQRYGCRVIYDCHDLWDGFQNIGADLLAAEGALFELSDSVLFSSTWLMEHKTGEHPGIAGKSKVLRNAVRAEDFDFLPRRPRSDRNKVGYVGSLNFWFDVESVRLAAQRHPEWEFTLIGRIESPEIRQLESLPNIRLMGEVPYSTLRTHLQLVDVCIIPFKISPLTLATNPLKLYEYFACGHPVVSSPLPEVQEFGNLVYLANDPEEFTSQLEAAMWDDDPSAALKRRLIAEGESWSSRCADIAGLFGAGETQSLAISNRV
jgi:glycosyltransferase involved in cell wall biosynthesis